MKVFTHLITHSIIFFYLPAYFKETVFLFTNGLWMWPGVEEGYIQYTQEGYKLTTISLRPLVFEAEAFLTGSLTHLLPYSLILLLTDYLSIQEVSVIILEIKQHLI